MKYFGEQETQDVSNAALAKNIPLTFLLIYVVLLFLFPSNYRKPVLIMLMLPLVFIGVVWGLLLFGKSLDFFAILGLLGLIGMNIKNAIVLVDEIGLQLKDGKGAVPAVVEATKTRIVPVTMVPELLFWVCFHCWAMPCLQVWRLPLWVVCSYRRY